MILKEAPLRAADFPQRLADIMEGKKPIPNYEPLDWAEGLQCLCLAGWFLPKVSARAFVGKNAYSCWARYFLSTTQDSAFDGRGIVILYSDPFIEGNRTDKPAMGRFALCKHDVVVGANAQPSTGWHPAHCSKCRLDMTVDSS